MIPNKKVILIIRDGWGVSEKKEGNAVLDADAPVYHLLLEECPHTLLHASGTHVGLPEGMMGNSEVGHLNLGAGRVVREMVTIINKSIEDGSFFSNPVLIKAIRNCKEHNSSLHLFGALQNSGVHAMNTHLYALLKLAKQQNFKDVKIHIIADGKDSPQRSVGIFIEELNRVIKELGLGKIVTIIGKDYGMDRDNNWERIKGAYDCINLGVNDESSRKAESVDHAIFTAYENEEGDWEITPTVIGDYSGVKDNDSIIFFNYRLDSARELTKAFVDPNFTGFLRRRDEMKNILFVCFAEYYKELEKYSNAYIAFHPEVMQDLLGSIISQNNLKQLRISESEKYAHVTYFFNGEIELPYPREERIIIPSPKVKSFKLKPESSSREVTSRVISEMERFDFVVLNLASADLAGHTGDYEATIKGVEVVDECVGKILKKVKELGWVAVITSDHGNCEEKIVSGKITPTHSGNPVDLIIYNYDCRIKIDSRRTFKLADVAPTLLKIMGIPKPIEMTGECLVE